ncbi:MAG: hypothetical protein QOE32_1149, partial [Pseudonocardiales bacterium]|nr:hypothetical protein [Pseudonocardiales bacterium]
GFFDRLKSVRTPAAAVEVASQLTGTRPPTRERAAA